LKEVFDSHIKALPILLKTLLEMHPINPISLPQIMPLKGIYLFSENGNHLYVGRTNNIKKRIQNHCRLGASHNQATFAFRVARSDTNQHKASYKTEGLRKQLEDDPIFGPAFIKAKERIRNMELRFVEINDPVLQALFEIYASMILKTPFNDFENH